MSDFIPDPPDQKSGLDYAELAAGLDDMREVMRSMVAGLTADGFSYEQARWIVVGIFTTHLKGKDASDG